MPTPLSVAHTAPEQVGRLSGEKLVDNRRFGQGDPLAVCTSVVKVVESWQN